MNSAKKFLLIDDARNQHWQSVLREALASLGSLQIAEEKDTLSLIMTGTYDMLIVDAAAVNSIPLFVARARAQQPNICIVVATSDPSWVSAREALQSGATDYIEKFLDRLETLWAINAALKKWRQPLQ